MNAEERAALHSILEQVAPLRAYGIVRTVLVLELAHRSGRLPIPLGTIDDEGRLSIDALAAHVPIVCAHAYARDLAELLGATTAGPQHVVLIDAQGNRPLATSLLGERRSEWTALLQRHTTQIRHAL